MIESSPRFPEARREQPVAVREAFENFFRSTYPELLNFAYAILGRSNRAAAEDVVQEACVQLLEHWDKVDNPRPWAFAVVRRRAIDQIRKDARRAAESLDAIGDLPALVAYSEDRDGIMDLIRALEQLPARQRQVILMRTVLGFTHREIAEELGLSEGTIASHLHRARSTIAAVSGTHPE
ncbi:RNA polymerase sigma factor [Streptomyces aureus]